MSRLLSGVARRALAPLSGLACRVAPTAAEQAIAPAALSTSSLLSGAAGSFVNQARQHAGSTEGTTAYHVGDSTNIKWHEGSVPREGREKLIGQRGCVLWFTGLSGSGKSTVAYTLEHALYEEGKLAMVLDGDNIRHGLCKNLSFSAEDREENIRRIGEVSKLFADTGIITLVSFISPYRRDRDAVRALMPEKDFIEIYMKIPLEVCEQRDPKGLYKAARAGKIKGFTGIDDPYEHPENPELEITVSEADGVMQPPAAMAKEILEYLRAGGYLSGPQ